MDELQSVYRGCLLGLAAGDAMGYTVDELSLEEIRENYGPGGLMGYDLRNDSAQVTSYTQIAAYTANGLLLGLTRGKPNTWLRFIAQALKEWAKRQHFPRDPEKSFCWVSQIPELRRRHCRDAWMLDAMRFDAPGTPDKPINSAATPGALLAGVVIGLFYRSDRMEPSQVGTLALHTAALTHGDPEPMLCAVTLAYAVAGLVQEPHIPLKEHFTHAVEAMDNQFRERFSQTAQLSAKLKLAIGLAESRAIPNCADMEQLRCDSAGECLAGAMYACLLNPDDLDGALITAVNHSGRSAAVGAITGAILGLTLTESALPDFYLESLEAAPALRVLADDLVAGSPAAGLFNDDWDQKYTQGVPLIES